MISKGKTKLINASKSGKTQSKNSTKKNSLSSNKNISNSSKVINLNQKTYNPISNKPSSQQKTSPYQNQLIHKNNNKMYNSQSYITKKNRIHSIKKENSISGQTIINNSPQKQKIVKTKIIKPKKIIEITTSFSNSNRVNKFIYLNSNNDFHRNTKTQLDSKIHFENCLNYNDNVEDDDNFNVYFSKPNKIDYRKTSTYQINRYKNSEISLKSFNNNCQTKEEFYNNLPSKKNKENMFINLMGNINSYENLISYSKSKNENNIKENKVNVVSLKNRKVSYDFDNILNINNKNKKIKKKLLEIFYNIEKKQKTILGKIQLNNNFFFDKNSNNNGLLYSTKNLLVENTQNKNNNSVMRSFFRYWKRLKIIYQTKLIKKSDFKKDNNIIIRTVIYKAEKPNKEYNFKKHSKNSNVVLKMEKIKKAYEIFHKTFVKIYSKLIKKYFNKLHQNYILNKKKFSVEKLISFFHKYYKTNDKLFFFRKLKEIKSNNYLQKTNNNILSFDNHIKNDNKELLTSSESNDVIWTETAGKWVYQKNNQITDSMFFPMENEIGKKEEKWTKNIENFHLIELDESSDSLYEIENESNQKNLNNDKIIKINTFLLNEVLNEEYDDQNKIEEQNNIENETKEKKINESETNEKKLKENEKNENKDHFFNTDYYKIEDN